MAIFPLWGVQLLQNSVHHKAYCVAYHHLIQANLVEQLEDLAAILAENVQLAVGELLLDTYAILCINL